jgi:hypothetical protein
MASLVPWKKKVNKYRDEADGDKLESRGPRLIDTIQEPEFIMRDETNAEVMKALKIKWW